MRKSAFQPGINTLCTDHTSWLRNKKIALLSNNSAIDSSGKNSAQVLKNSKAAELRALMGPEHGYSVKVPAGESVAASLNTALKIPVHSLYGKTRCPPAAVMMDIDALVYDLQPLGARPYTYLATLLNAMRSCARSNKAMIIADRPVPLPFSIDGPGLKHKFRSFVASAPLPMLYSMTPGETALWLQKQLRIKVDLKVARMKNCRRDKSDMHFESCWMPPSPEIRTPASARCYLSTVFCEALDCIDNGRGTKRAFQVFGRPGMDNIKTVDMLNALSIPGAEFKKTSYRSRFGRYCSKTIDGVQITVSDHKVFRPVSLSIDILHCLIEIYGSKLIASMRGKNSIFFDKLYGTDSIRKACMASESPAVIKGRWQKGLRVFTMSREDCLLY